MFACFLLTYHFGLSQFPDRLFSQFVFRLNCSQSVLALLLNISAFRTVVRKKKPSTVGLTIDIPKLTLSRFQISMNHVEFNKQKLTEKTLSLRRIVLVLQLFHKLHEHFWLVKI